MKNLSQSELNELFLKAAAEGDIDQAIECLTNGANLNSKTPKGYNALFVSATRARRDFFEWILAVEQKGIKVDVNNKNNEGNTVLFEIVKDNLSAFYVEELIKAGANVDMPSQDGATALLQACANCNMEQVKVLIENKANTNLFNKNSKTTPFLMASSEGNFELVKFLIENNANINEVDAYGRNVLLNALFKPTRYLKEDQKKEHEELLKYLVENTKINLDYVAPSGVTALWMASYMGKKDLVNTMLDKNVKVDVLHNMDHNEGKMSALHQWCRLGNTEIVEKFLKNGAKLSVLDEMGNSPEAYAFSTPSSSQELKQLMLDNNCDVNATFIMPGQDLRIKNLGVPILANVISQGDSQKEMVIEMMKKGSKISYEPASLHMYEPLLLAIAASAPELVDILLEEKKIDINKLLNLNLVVEEKESISFMSLLCMDGKNAKLSEINDKKAKYEILLKAQKENEKNGVQSEIISKETFEQMKKDLDKLKEITDLVDVNKQRIFKSLIKAGYHINLENESKKTALFFCKDENQAILLKNNGANIFHKDKEGNNLLTHSILGNNEKLIPFYKKEFQIKKSLNNIYYDLAFTEVNNYQQQQLLQSGIINFTANENLKNIDKIKKEEFVIQEIPGINYQDSDGNSALLVSCANDLPFLASLYLNMGANINLANELGETPLMHAIGTKNRQLVDYLIEAGSDCNAVTIAGKSVMDFAEETEKLDIQKSVRQKLSDKEIKKPKF